jgi:hypothetical protein
VTYDQTVVNTFLVVGATRANIDILRNVETDPRGMSLIALRRTAVQPTASVNEETPLAKEVVMTFPVTPEMLALAHGDKSNIVLQYFDEATKQWSDAGVRQVADPRADAATFAVSHFSVWALIVRTPIPTPPAAAATPAATTPGAAVPPGQVAPIPAKTGTGLPPLTHTSTLPWIQVALAGVAVTLLGSVAGGALLRRRR